MLVSAGAQADTLLSPFDISGAFTPVDVAVHVSGTRAYVSSSGGTPSGSIAEIDTATGAVVSLLSFPYGGISRLAASPDGQWLYVLSTAVNTVEAYSTNWPNPALPPSSPLHQASIGLTNTPYDVAFDPSGSLAFVSISAGSVDVVSVLLQTVQANVSVSGSLRGITAVNVPSRGLQVYVAIASSFTPKLAAIDWPAGTVRTIALSGASPLFPAANAAASKLYVSTGAGRVFSINTATDAVTSITGVGQNLGNLCVTVTPWGERVYLADTTSTGSIWSVRRIDATTDTVMTPVSGVSKNPQSVAALPNGTEVFAAATKPSPAISRLDVIQTSP
jgi:DNA-binding beta-propeller fold protein YncE